MTYDEAVAHLYSRGLELVVPANGLRRKFDLAHMRTLMNALGDPQSGVPSVLIAGTNGKGSTAATLAAICTAAGYRTGLYTSPHLARVNERIQLAGKMLPARECDAEGRGREESLSLLPIPDDRFASLYSRIWGTAETLVGDGQLPCSPSFFELLTAVAFCWFAEQRAEIAVLEVGLGGRLDATNIVEPLLSVITDISLDHQDYLGDTLGEIAREKAGILRERGILVTLPQHPEVNQAIGEAAMALGVRGVNAAEYVPAPARGGGDAGWMQNRYRVQLGAGAELVVDSPLPGQHQQRNVALAIATAVELWAVGGFDLSGDAIERGIRSTVWPGRLEMIGDTILLDVAHNPAGAWALRSALAGFSANRPRTLIFSCLRDKNLREMAQILFPLFEASGDAGPLRGRDTIVLVPVTNPRAVAIGDLASVAAELGVPALVAGSVVEGLREARRVTPRDGLIVVTGSVYLVGEVRGLVLHGEVEFAGR